MNRNLTVDIDGNPAGFDRAADDVAARALALEREVARLEARMKSYEAQVKKTSASQEKQAATVEKTNRQMQGGMVSLIAAGVAAGAGVTAAGVAFVAFTAVAVPSIKRVTDAQMNLNVSWETLDKRQRTSAVVVQGLIGDYQKLAKSYEPQTLAAFNSVVLTTRGLLPELNTVLKSSATGVQDFTGQIERWLQGPDAKGFLTWSGQAAPNALHTLGTTATTTASLTTTLVQQIAPLGLSFLQAANGGLGLANSLARSNPQLAQLAITALAVRAPVTALQAGIGNLGAKMVKAGEESSGLARVGGLLNKVAGASPVLWVAAGTALAFYALKAFSAKSATQELIENLVTSTHATGNNIAGYQQLNEILSAKLNASMAKTTDLAGGLAISMGVGASAAEHQRAAQKDYQDQIDKNNQSIKNVLTASSQLGSQMGITGTQAIELANAAGVDLSKSLDKSGKLTEDATAKIQNYAQAARLASDPTTALKLDFDAASNSTLLMKDRLAGLTAALDAYFNPSIAAYKATLQLKDGFVNLDGLLKAAKGKMDGSTAASRNLQAAFADQLVTVANLYTATFNQKHSLDDASAAVRKQLPLLYALAGNNKDARQQVDNLARSTGNVAGAMEESRAQFMAQAKAMHISHDRAVDLWNELQALKKLGAINLDINVTAAGTFATTAGYNPAKKFPGLFKAAGGEIPMVPGGSRAYDSVPAMLRVDEHVWTPEEVDAVGGHAAMYRMRRAALAGKVRGYAAGGRVDFAHDPRSDAAVVQQVTEPVRAGIIGMMTSVANMLAQAWKEFVGSGGPVVQAARSMIGLPYSWGGGGTGGPSYGIGRGAGTYGFDCSGLTEYAWYKGKGVDIGGVTDTQWANSSGISGPRPGALAFPDGPSVHVMLGSDRPGMVIQAPHTGAYVEEVPRSSGNWRWPNFATGGQVTALGADYVNGRLSVDAARLARALQVAGSGPREQHRAQIADASTLRVWAEPETGGEAYIPLAASKRASSTEILAMVARKFGMRLTRMAQGGILSFAGGGTTGGDLNLSDILSTWTTAVNPATAADVSQAVKDRATQAAQVAAAQRALAKAEQARRDRINAAERRLRRARTARQREDARIALEKARRTDTIRAAEAKLKKERLDLADATKKLADTESRFQYARQSPATQLGSALAFNIKNTSAFIRNLTTLNSRGFGLLAQKLLAQGDAQAEKIAADAVTFSNAKLGTLQNQVNTAQGLQNQLANLGNTFTVSAALQGGKITTFAALQSATGLDATTLSTVIHGMAAQLAKTAAGRSLLADMKTYGFARGGMVSGPGGIDQVPIMATAGEWITPKDQVAPNLPILRAIRAGARLGDVYLNGGRPAAAPATVHKSIEIMQGATVQLAEKVDVDLLADQLNWEVRTASFGGN